MTAAAVLLVMALPGVASPGVEDPAGDGAAGGFLTGPNAGDPEEIALAYVRDHAASLGLSAADVADLAVLSVVPGSASGASHVNVGQRFDGLEIFGSQATVTVAADGSVAFVGDHLVAGLPAASASASVEAAPDEAVAAVEAAAAGLGLDEPSGARAMSRAAAAGAADVVVSGAGISDEPIPAGLGWQPTEDGLRLAWQVVIDDSTSPSLWNATVDAQTGELLEADDWTSHSNMQGLVALLARPGGASSSASVRLVGTTPFEGGSPNPVEDGSSYRVLALPKESPNDGPRTLVTNPADATASPFGWHDVSGTPGPDYTVTRGNNVHAYTDRGAPNNQPDPGSDPDGGPSLTFDFPMDLNEHPQAYSDAAVTNLFYLCNAAHDLFYLYGFDEASGNFQVNNYGRGGAGGDDVRCEAQDGSGQNNANFSTPAQDGGRPRMQMYLWPGSGLPNAVTVDSGPAAGTYLAQYARFSPAPTSAGTPGQLTLVDDGVGNPNDGCTPYSLPSGAIAIVDESGSCNFYTQTVNAENAGASAVVVVGGGANPGVMNGSMDPPVGIPVIRVSTANGNAIKAGLPATGSVHRNLDREPMRDGDIHAGIVIHEYSHGVSNRLTGGPTVNCLSGQEQMGEGWSDYHAIAMLIDPALDDPEAPRGMSTYTRFTPNRTFPGGRPAPYSRNMEIQPATYDSIKTGGWLNGGSVSQPHGIGHIWAAILWDMTWDLIDKHGFNPNLYEPWSTGGNNLAYQLVNDGLKIQGCGPGFVVGRDAIITADQLLTGGENQCTLWASFARRGLGYSAEQGSNASRNDNDEAFDTHPNCANGFLGGTAPQPALNILAAGRTVPLRFDIGGNRGLDILASNSPYSRQVDCETLATEDPDSPFITPRPLPLAAETPGGAGLSVSSTGQYLYPWQTSEAWVDTCREFVLTRDDGEQHRAYFRFVEPD